MAPMRDNPSIRRTYHRDSAGYIPYSGWKVDDYKYGDPLDWGSKKVELFGKTIRNGGKNLEGKKLLNADMLAYLMDNQHLIPEDWKVGGKSGDSRYRDIVFWGTIYRHVEDGNLYVRYLIWFNDQWQWNYSWVYHGSFGTYPVAIALE